MNFQELLDWATDQVNAAPKGSEDELKASEYRRGILDGYRSLGYEPDLIRQDLRQIRMGNDRPMCGGVWLDKERA